MYLALLGRLFYIVEMTYEQTSKHEDLELIVSDANAAPVQLSYSYVKSITNNFSKEREIGRGGYGIVYKVRFLFDLLVIRFLIFLVVVKCSFHC
jgi:hypothetical protein